MKKYILVLLLICASVFGEQLSLSGFFVRISDSLDCVKDNNFSCVSAELSAFELSFKALEQSSSPAARGVKMALSTAKKELNSASLEALSVALIAFEKEQNPTDYQALIKNFEKKVMPAYRAFETATPNGEPSELGLVYKKLYDAWQRNERVVGDLSSAHYGKIETAMAMYRLAMLNEPMDRAAMSEQVGLIKGYLAEFLAGKYQNASSENGGASGLLTALAGLKTALDNIGKDDKKAKAEILSFITAWPAFEGEIRTRDAGLYNRIESDLPSIAANLSAGKANLEDIIWGIEALNLNAGYNAIDVALVLIREGLEALLIIIALFAALKTSTKAKVAISLGAGLGVVLSIVAAVLLATLVSLDNADVDREILEGFVGIVAVDVMVFIIAWLHSKSSAKAWEQFVKNQAKILAGGSVLCLGGLAFLAVFREGAETILFYAAMLPKTEIVHFGGGLALGVMVLAIFAYFMDYITKKIPMRHIFRVMSLLLYALGFKILGMSVHGLELTGVIDSTIISALPSISFIGFYNSIESISAQVIYILAVLALFAFFGSKEQKNTLRVARA